MLIFIILLGMRAEFIRYMGFG